ncbi:MAG: VWA domain-containing protein [Sandaracinaceae bacterium]|nr:VWA domain-containing protein [Sandaracinaceae bacterium]
MKHLVPVLSVLALVGCVEPLAGGELDEADPFATALPADGDAGECAQPLEGCLCDHAVPIDCYLPPVERDGVLSCRAGTRYCRDGAWSGCESVHTYELVGRETSLVTGPTECNPCDPACAISRDVPSSADLPGRSTRVEYDPSRGGIRIEGGGSGTPPLPDSDGDGIPDIADDCPGPGAIRNPDGTCASAYYFHVLPYGGPAEIDPLAVRVQVRTADVYFLMDTTGSMGGELNRLKTDLTSGTFISGCSGGIIGAIRCTIPDAWFGVGYHDDYPYSPFGGSGDDVYRNRQDITSSVSSAQTAVNGLGLHWGNDGPESQTQALYAIATGNGFGSYLSARSGCAAGRWGYPCFRDGTIPIVVLFTDAPFHNGPYGYNYYGTPGGVAASWTQTVNALNARNIRVITIQSGGTYGLDDARALADATGSYSSSGSRYVFSINHDGSGLSSAVVNAIVDLANYNRMDITARATDNTATAIDERRFVSSITAVSWGPGSCTGISGGHTFVQCLPGTSVDFRIAFRNDFVMPTSVPQVFNFFIEVIGDGSYVLQRIPVRIVVPPTVPLYPPEGSYWRDYDSTLYCAPNERPIWGNLRWEIVSLPAGTSIRWEIRVSGDLGALASTSPITFTTPSTMPPVDLAARIAAAGRPALLPYLRVTAVLRANADRTQTPVLRSFEVQYTCVPVE